MPITISNDSELNEEGSVCGGTLLNKESKKKKERDVQPAPALSLEFYELPLLKDQEEAKGFLYHLQLKRGKPQLDLLHHCPDQLLRPRPKLEN